MAVSQSIAAAIAEIDERYERGTETFNRISRAAEGDHPTQSASSTTESGRSSARHTTTHITTKRRHRDQLDARQSRRQEQLDRLAADAHNSAHRRTQTGSSPSSSLSGSSRAATRRGPPRMRLSTRSRWALQCSSRPLDRARSRGRASARRGIARRSRSASIASNTASPIRTATALTPRTRRTGSLIKQVNRPWTQLSIYRANQGLDIGPDPFKGTGNDESLGMN